MTFPLFVYLHIAQIGKNIEIAAKLIQDGKLVAIPTETVYGLAANALNEKAVLSIFQVKERPFFDPLIIHLPSMDKVGTYAVWHDDRLKQLSQAFWPGPLTILLPKKDLIPDIVTSGLPMVAVRVPDHRLTLDLLNLLNLPLAAPSANPFGYVSPTQPEHVNKQLGNKIDYILDGGPSGVGLESTIVGVEDGEVCVYRLGGLPLEDIEKVVGKVSLKINVSSDPKAPGQLKSHYAPRKPLLIGNINELLIQHKNKKLAVICFGKLNFDTEGLYLFNLSPQGSMNEAAVNLFKCLRETDETDADMVICERLPEEGLGKAINDRLTRASVH